MSHVEKRRNPRVNLEIPVLILTEAHPKTVPAIISNLSVSGAQLRTELPIVTPGSHVEIQLVIERPILFQGKEIQPDSVESYLLEERPTDSIARWAEGDGRFGVEFVHFADLINYLLRSENKG